MLGVECGLLVGTVLFTCQWSGGTGTTCGARGVDQLHSMCSPQHSAVTSCPSCLLPAERANTINAAIASVKASTKTVSQSYVPSHRTQNRIKSEEYDARGRARIMFEKAVRKAEVELMKHHYKSELESTDNNVKAEALAKVALHRPGSYLTEEEIAHIQQETMAECHKQPPIPDCSSTKVLRYRTINGTCNNLDKPAIAAAGEDFRRLIVPHYEDGIQEPTGTLQKIGKDLLHRGPFDPPYPSAREASRTILLNRSIDDNLHSHMIMQWGQFLDHDLDLAPEQSEEECPLESCEVTEECCPIPVVRNPDGDPTFGGQECLFFPRSIPSCSFEKGKHGPREQFNALTPYIDASNVYGSSEEVANALREFRGGRLLVGPAHAPGAKPSLPLLPVEQAVSPVFLALCPGLKECYVAGDIRANEHISLVMMHTIWVREHNRIVAELAKSDPTLTDEELYQTARKIIGGLMQKIVFEDYLPEVLGRQTVEQLILGGFARFDPHVDPRVPNAYATAAFRYGHSLIRANFARLGRGYRPISAGPLNLVDSFFNPDQYNISLGTDPIMRGLLTERSRRSDEFLNPVITNALFRTPEDLGRDLGALNINRGRDHGLAPYLVWKQYCINFFRDNFNIIVKPEFRSELTELHLLRTYGSLDTVDLFPGGMAEAPFIFGRSRSIIGPTFTCIFINNYRALSRGDRFFYLGDAAFTEAQRTAVQQGSLSKVICDNSDGIVNIQANAFNVPSISNPRVPCSSLPSVDLSAFVPSGQCRQSTFMRITTTGKVTAIAALIDKLWLSRKRDVTFLGAGSHCLEVSCPTNYWRLIGVVFRSRCRAPIQAPGLPRTVSKFNVYDAKVPTDLLVAANGFYSSRSACRAGTVNALTFSCGTTAQETEEESQMSDDSEIIRKVNETYQGGNYTLIQEASTNLKVTPLSSNEEDIHQDTADVTDQDALLQSLEEALRGLK